MKIFPTEKLPVLSWCENPDANAIEQAKHLAMLPFAYDHIALMPDTHMGYGMPIGAVLATKDQIVIPNAVGVDIGCGMIASLTKLTTENVNKEKLKKIIENIKAAIPMGFNRNANMCPDEEMPRMTEYTPICEREYSNARRQMGSLGGGNHFIEIQKDKANRIWIMVHTGSRNIGKKVADHYNRLAEANLVGTYSKVEEKWNLAFLDTKREAGKNYMNEMRFCQEFAKRNREKIVRAVEHCMDTTSLQRIDICHNFAQIEHHKGENVIVHRKGATEAEENCYGIIPGNQGTKSYIVKGKGNKESFQSCSHGAGRAMGRKEAMRTLDIEKEIAIMNNAGIVHEMASMEQLDEAPSAYKNIDKVMEEQKDLVDIVEELHPIAVIKG